MYRATTSVSTRWDLSLVAVKEGLISAAMAGVASVGERVSYKAIQVPLIINIYIPLH